MTSYLRSALQHAARDILCALTGGSVTFATAVRHLGSPFLLGLFPWPEVGAHSRQQSCDLTPARVFCGTNTATFVHKTPTSLCSVTNAGSGSIFLRHQGFTHGTHYRCSESCDYDLCSKCYKRQAGEARNRNGLEFPLFSAYVLGLSLPNPLNLQHHLCKDTDSDGDEDADDSESASHGFLRTLRLPYAFPWIWKVW